MHYIYNGQQRTADDGLSVAQLVDTELGSRANGEGREGIAVAVDGEVVPASAWETTVIRDGATVDLLTAVQGG